MHSKFTVTVGTGHFRADLPNSGKKNSISSHLYILLNAKKNFVCVCIIKLLCHFLPDLAQILNKAMNSKGAASKPVPGADFTQLLILRHLFVSHTQILADSQSDCEKVVEPKRNPNRTDFFGIQLSIQLGTKTD